jgi:hypothetical protein
MKESDKIAMEELARLTGVSVKTISEYVDALLPLVGSTQRVSRSLRLDSRGR